MDIGIVHSIWTVILFSSFIGIVIWAFSKRQKSRFEEAANLVFADEENDVATRDKYRS
ncbi:cbb3-type cytochrome oxidase subunit 3 [Photobacterium nomapromontoriensis]|uniref:cbb3-type cytochrome oxidase subunit 3 n=1 Tax=Photobacterium nomapromontoriensis TaxID=2910237 RepID=UPI003D0A5347